MEHILQCDLDSVIQFINDLEKEKSERSNFLAIVFSAHHNDLNSDLDKAQTEILEARVENNFNILHACVALCVPPTNKDAVDLATGKDKLLESTTSVSTTKGSSRCCYDTKWEELVGSTRGYR